MTEFENQLFKQSEAPLSILDESIKFAQYTPIDFSIGNSEINDLDISKPAVCQKYIDQVLERNGAKVAYGGYLEVRNLYRTYKSFQKRETAPRNIHLGMDFWAPEGTSVQAVIDGRVHSFKNNNTIGDYGPTILLEHKSVHRTFYTLYGHLSSESIKDLYPGKAFLRGETLGWLGKTSENVNYAPHLHFQIIDNIGDNFGDYPGVSSSTMLKYYQMNCPDPNLLLKLQAADR